jgi:hypothetical protein
MKKRCCLQLVALNLHWLQQLRELLQCQCYLQEPSLSQEGSYPWWHDRTYGRTCLHLNARKRTSTKKIQPKWILPKWKNCLEFRIVWMIPTVPQAFPTWTKVNTKTSNQNKSHSLLGVINVGADGLSFLLNSLVLFNLMSFRLFKNTKNSEKHKKRKSECNLVSNRKQDNDSLGRLRDHHEEFRVSTKYITEGKVSMSTQLVKVLVHDFRVGLQWQPLLGLTHGESSLMKLL